MGVTVETFDTLEALEAKHGSSLGMGIYAGPIHQHGEHKFVQTYIGQHEWLAIRVDDPTDIRYDPGFAGKTFGYGIALFTDGSRWYDFAWPNPKKDELSEPVSDHKPITFDEYMFGDRKKVEDYLEGKTPEF